MDTPTPDGVVDTTAPPDVSDVPDVHEVLDDIPEIPDTVVVDTPDTPDTVVEQCIAQEFADRVAPLIANTCSLCHTAEGLAAASGLGFASLHSTLGSMRDETNRDQLVAYLTASANPDWVVLKPTGQMAHGGGPIVAADSLEAAVLQSFVESVLGEGACDALPEASLDPANFVLASSRHTLWLASRLLIDRAPTAQELEAVTDDIASIEPILNTFYETESFAARIAQIYEDDLHTNMFNGKNDSYSIQRAWGLVPDSQGNTRGNFRWMDALAQPQSDEWKDLLVNSTFGVWRAPRELVQYVIREHKDFGEILTADYTMVNAYSVRTFEAEALLPTNAPFAPAQVSTEDRTTFVPVVLDTVPTAGLLTDLNFLAVYPTTPVNLNRNRSREINHHFLATDILSLSNRAILDFGSTEVNPTYNNKACVVCHRVMDPVSGAFQNWPRVGGVQGMYDPLSLHAQARWDSTDPADQLVAPGSTMTQLVPVEQEDRSVQWLASRIVEDPRFGLSVAHALYEGLTGREALQAPPLGTLEYGARMRAFQLERSLLESVAQAFMNSGRDIRVLVTALIQSPLIRTVALSDEDTTLEPSLAASRVGLNKMPHPEDLERKLKAATGYSWYHYYAKTDAGEANYHWNNHTDRPGRSLLVEFREQCGNGGHGCYARWYSLMGGLDVNPVGGNDTRPDEPNVIIAAILGRMAVEMPLRLVAREFSIQSQENGLFIRTLFPHVTLEMVPEDENGLPIESNTNAIVANIQHLFWQLHGHQRAADDVEVQAAYNLFVDVWKLGLTTGKQLGFSERVDAPEVAAMAAAETAAGKTPLERIPVNVDTYNTVRAWRVVLDYMLNDPAFVYDSIDGEVAP